MNLAPIMSYASFAGWALALGAGGWVAGAFGLLMSALLTKMDEMTKEEA